MRQMFQILAIPFRYTEVGELEVLILQRSKTLIWQFVAGGGENSESIYETVMREIKEETGFDAKNLYSLDTVNSIPVNVFSEEQRMGWPEQVFVIPEKIFAFLYDADEVILSDEHSSWRFVTPNEAYSLLKYDSNKTALQELVYLIENERLFEKTYDNITSGSSWLFDEQVANCFGNMLQRSIPEYSVMRELVYTLGSSCLADGDLVLDIGCSWGGAILPFVSHYQDRLIYYGYEISDHMLSKARSILKKEIDQGFLHIEKVNLENEFPVVQAKLVLSILTLQFLTYERRKQILKMVYDILPNGGMLIIVEKVNVGFGKTRELINDTYHEFKHNQGYSYEQIEKKSKSLTKVLCPISKEENIQMIKEAGFSDVVVFWQCLNFCGILSRKVV